MLKTRVASLKTSTCASCLAAFQGARVQTHENMTAWNICLTLLISLPLSSPTPSPYKMNSSHYPPLKSNGNTNSVCKWLFLISVCSCENTVRSCMPVTVCACVFCIDCCRDVGKWAWISVKKEEQKTIHKQREWPEEWKRHKMSLISIWDRRRDLFKLSESSFLSDDCIQCPPSSSEF